MISKLKALTLCSLNAVSKASELCNLASKLEGGTLALAGELCITKYENLGDRFEENLISNLKASINKNAFLGFTHFNGKFNEFVLLNNKEIIYSQLKSRLFTPNLEEKFFGSGGDENIKIFNIGKIKLGVLICFELRFNELWNRLDGADIILIPACWGKSRSRDFKILSRALALQNRCYVVACSDNDLVFDGVFLPDGKFQKESKFDSFASINFKKSLGIK